MSAACHQWPACHCAPVHHGKCRRTIPPFHCCQNERRRRSDSRLHMSRCWQRLGTISFGPGRIRILFNGENPGHGDVTGAIPMAFVAHIGGDMAADTNASLVRERRAGTSGPCGSSRSRALQPIGASGGISIDWRRREIGLGYHLARDFPWPAPVLSLSGMDEDRGRGIVPHLQAWRADRMSEHCAEPRPCP